MNIRNIAAVSAAALALALAAAGCRSSSSSAPSTAMHVAAGTAEAKGVTKLENCLPNGKAIVPSIMNGTASVLTYVQFAKAFSHKNLPATEAHCLGGGSHPFQQAAHKFGACFTSKWDKATNAAVRPYEAHPVRNRHQLARVGSQATLAVAAGCIGRL